MAARHKATKKTVKRTVTSGRRVRPVENVIPGEAAVISNTSFQPVQTAQPIQPIVPSQPIQPPIQQVAPMQTVPMPSATQPMPVQEASAENSTTQPVDVSADPEPEIKMGTEDRLAIASDTDGKATDPTAPPQITTENNEDKSAEKKNLLLPILVIVLLGIAVLGGLFIYRQNFSKKVEKIKEVSLSPTPIEKATPKPLDISKFTIEILNGSGIEGAASSQKGDLESIGFKVAAIGNADNGDYTETVIQAKKDVDKAFLDKLRTVLEESFEVSTEELDEEAKTDIVIIIGSKKTE